MARVRSWLLKPRAESLPVSIPINVAAYCGSARETDACFNSVLSFSRRHLRRTRHAGALLLANHFLRACTENEIAYYSYYLLGTDLQRQIIRKTVCIFTGIQTSAITACLKVIILHMHLHRKKSPKKAVDRKE